MPPSQFALSGFRNPPSDIRFPLSGIGNAVFPALTGISFGST
jgi:hypothetical protein